MSDNTGSNTISIFNFCKSGLLLLAFAFFVFPIGIAVDPVAACYAQDAKPAESDSEPTAERGRRGEGRRGAGRRGEGRRGEGRQGEGRRGQRGDSETAQEKTEEKKPTDESADKAAEADKPKKKPAAKKKITPALKQDVADMVKWRSIGPANMGGRITALTVYEKEPSTWWAATASGGLLKTTNNGVTFEHQFDDQATVSIGDVQVAQSDSNIVWVGTGESNPRNSVSWGDGVYKSTDSGKTWKNMGLNKIFQTGAIAVHPENPDVVYVGALGRLWGPNKERGLFMTEDGGKNWKKVLYVNDVTGVIDVQINPKNFDEVLIATYERKRDGFDGNDPEKRFGAGSGIYKSSDGGKSFKRLSKGLPTCKLGRIGLDYFEADPNFIYAVVESEKIAESREDLPYGGLTGEDADVGAKIVRVVEDGPSAKAGLEVDDIVIQVDEKIVTDYDSMLSELRKKSAGDTTVLRVYRDEKLVEVSIELSTRPEANGRTPRSPFTGTLGGQAANMQDQQGKEGYQFGGVYMSKDGGESWTRINSLNPRPMYYSNIQVDPVDRNNIYLCGTSLYKTSDGGETFTGDGHDNTVHVDHHALWIDKSNPKHIILGNDGGIYVTYDRMENWDHHNHVAIAQFYHASVDSNPDYKAYGGLQDNGSWAGPVRASDGSGPINSDWIRVGGGDGFVTLTDPNDPEQVYFESQNGGMGRVHMGTGERGFISPRPPRGEPRYRFNWKTPFILSPHNSQIHYSAGNFVFRSYKKGDSAKAFSPEIVNSDRGAGSAITESSVEPGVLYVGTTDGALWVTRDSGQLWEPLFAEPTIAVTKKEDDKKKSNEKAEAKSDVDAKSGANTKSSDKKGAAKPDTESAERESEDESLTGIWTGNVEIEGVGPVEFALELFEKDGKLSGATTSTAGDLDLESGTFDSDTNKIEFTAVSDGLTLVCDGEVDGDKMSGTFEMNGEMTIDFEAERDPKSNPEPAQDEDQSESTEQVGDVSEDDDSSDPDDAVSGTWVGELKSPRGTQEITVVVDRKSDNNITGTFESERGVRDISEGFFEADTDTLTLVMDGGRFTMDFAGKVSDGTYAGEATINDQFSMEFSLQRGGKTDDKSGDKEGDVEQEEAEKDEEKTEQDEEKAEQDEEKAAKSVDESKDKDQPQEESYVDDPVSGTWVGELISPRGSQDLTLTLKRESDKKITGTMTTQRGDREIGRGVYDPEKKSLALFADSEGFSIDFTGELDEESYSGEASVRDRFQMEFSVKRESKEVPEPEEKKEVAPRVSISNLGDLLPGPRWVSSLEASKFEASHCYATFDGHRSDDDGVYVFKTEDFGKTWKSIKANIPDTAGSARVIREDVKNKNLLFLGCEFSSWYSIDAGASWTQIKGGLPTVSVHEFAIHPTGNDVVAGTHGRSLWVADVSVLRQLNKEVLTEDSALLKPASVTVFPRGMQRGKRATREFVGARPEAGTAIAYTLGKNARFVRLTIEDVRGDLVKSFETSTRKGVHIVNWDLSPESSGGGGRRQRRVAEGVYLVKLRVDRETHLQELTVKAAE